jgi:hypothetical protein
MRITFFPILVVKNKSADDARRLFAYIDPSLGKPLPERSYAVDCRLYTPENPKSKFKNLMVMFVLRSLHFSIEQK